MGRVKPAMASPVWARTRNLESSALCVQGAEEGIMPQKEQSPGAVLLCAVLCSEYDKVPQSSCESRSIYIVTSGGPACERLTSPLGAGPLSPALCHSGVSAPTGLSLCLWGTAHSQGRSQSTKP